MNARWGEWGSGLVVATLAILGGGGCTGVYSGTECGGPDQACCVGNTCSGSMVCGPESRCATAAPMYSVGGTVSGLSGSGLALRNGTDTLGIDAAGPFTFPTALPSGSSYAVSISNQPAGQSCTVSSGSGIVGSDDVTSVAVSCTSTPARTYTIGGAVTGLTGSGLVLQDNGADNLPIAGNGAFRFATELTEGDRYEITVLVQPSGQTCTVINGSGTVGAADVTGVAVSCVDKPTPRYTIGGTVSGLAGTGLLLRNNGTDDLPISANGAFTFSTALPTGASYAVTVAGQPGGPSQTCAVSSGAGTVGSGNVTGVVVQCVTDPVPKFTVGGTVAGLSGPGLVLRNNGGDDLAVATSGSFTFATPLTSGNPYSVTILSQPSGQTCSVSGGAGTVNGSNVTSVAVSCITNPPARYSVGGTVTGLTGAGLVLRNNGADDLSLGTSGPFAFPTALTTGSAYAVTVFRQPSAQTCTVSNGSGIIGSASVTSVAVSCITDPVPTYTVGGTVSGLNGPGLVLQDNGADNRSIGGNGPFTFTTALTSGDHYSVTVLSQPAGQTCTVSGGSGTIGSANVTSVVVGCVTNPIPKYRVGGVVRGLAGTGLVLRNNGGDDLAVGTDGAFSFATSLPTGASYSVTVSGQPTGPSQTCTVSNGSGTVGSADITTVAVTCVTNPLPRYTIGGTVTGLSGTGLVLRDNGGDDLAVTISGTFTFATSLTSGSAYAVTVASQPSGQTCTVSNGSGTVASANVTSVSVSCTTNPPPRYTVGGAVSGLTGTGLVLRNNGGDDLAITANGAFTFSTPLTSGSTYSVTVFRQPSGQSCTVSGGSGTVVGANVTSVSVSCVANRYTIGGTVSGLTGTGLVLRNNGGDDLGIPASGTFTFATALTTGSSYAVTVASQPSGQTCSVLNGSGTVAGANVTNVSVSCVANRYTIGGTVSGLTGTGLVLRNNGGDNLAVASNGTFTFATSLTSGSTYSVTVATQPSGQTCSVSNGSGTVAGANVTNVSVSCTANRYTLGGTVSGLTGTGLVLRNNGGDDLAVASNGTFTFATSLTSGSTYAVTVASQPSGQTCTVSNGSGTVAGTNVTSVSVSCVANRYTIGGTVSGLTGTGLVLRNNGGDDLAVASNGAFTFATSLTSGSPYAVTVAIQPPGQTCSVTNGTGTVAGANITTIAVACITNPPPRYTIGGTVSGLTGTGLVLRNNGGDNLAVASNGTFTFATSLTSGSTYSVTVATQPSGQTCSVSNGSGTVAGANVTNVSVSCAAPPSDRPTLLQHVSSSTNLVGRGLIGNDYRFTLPNPVRTGNVLILGISYGAPAGQVVTVHDSQGNSWPASPAVSQTDPDGNIASAIFVLPNARAGITTVTVSFSSAIRETIFQYTISEFQGVATTTPVSGTSRGSGAQPAISAGTFTPSNNDANGGNLIWSYFADSYGTTSFATEASRFTAGAGFTLLDADISWPTGSPPFPHASQYEVQSVAGPVTPSMTVTHNDGGGDVYVGVAVALRASPGAGTSPPPGMRIVHLSHLTNQTPGVGARRLQFPSSGNLIVVTLQEQNIIPVASVTDSLGNRYQQVVPDDSVPQFWFAQGPAATSPTLELTVNLTGGEGGGVTYLLYDVAGASTSSFDGFAFKTQYDDPTGSDVFDTPVITPLAAPGLTITATSFGQGPSSGLAAGCPAGAIFDLVYYTGETDLDTMDNADFRAHVFNTDTSTEHWNIAVANGNNGTNVSSTAVHFK